LERCGLSEGAVDPAVGVVEFDSIAIGMLAGDAMVKAAPLGSIYAGTIHPGKYLVLVSGDTASVDVALEAGKATGANSVLDWIFLPDIHPDVTAAMAARGGSATTSSDSLGIIETATVATLVEAADAGVKAAAVDLAAVRLGDGLGGKAYLLFCGIVAEVEAAIDAASARAEPTGHLVHEVVIPQLHDEMRHNLDAELRFRKRVVLRPQERGE